MVVVGLTLKWIPFASTKFVKNATREEFAGGEMRTLSSMMGRTRVVAASALIAFAASFCDEVQVGKANAAVLTCPTFGLPVEYCGSFFHLDNRGENGVGRAVGERISLGFVAVHVDPLIIRDHTWIVTANRDGSNIHVPLNYFPFTYIPEFYQRGFADTPARRADWYLGVTAVYAGVLTVQDDVVRLPSLAGVAQMPVIQSSLTLDSRTGRTASWELPQNVAHDAVWVGVLDREHFVNGSADRLLTIGLPAGTTSVNLNNYIALEPGHQYTLEIGLANTRSNTTNVDNPNLLAISRAFYDVVLPPPGAKPVVLPVTTESGVFRFNVPVTQNVPILIDPEVAVGYEYKIGEGDPLFGSVRLPEIGDPDGYTLCL